MGAISQLHGVALWFDCRFPGSQRQVFLSTAPHAPFGTPRAAQYDSWRNSCIQEPEHTVK